MSCVSKELQDVVFQVNRRFQAIEELLGSVSVDATIPDRSISNVKLILASITDAEIANSTISAGKLNIPELDDITKAAGTLTSGTIQNFNITTPTITGGTWSGGTLSTAVITGEFTGKAIITTVGSEIGPFNVTSAKLYSGTVEHNASQSYYGTGNNIAILDSTDGTYRLAVGHASYGSAPFRVTKAGVLTAVGATITTPTLTGGTISGTSISNCSVSATTLSVDPSSTVAIGAGTEIVFAGDTQFYRNAAGELRTDGSLIADGYCRGVAINGSSLISAGVLANPDVLFAPGVACYVRGTDFHVYSAASVDKFVVAAATGNVTTAGSIAATGSIISSSVVGGTSFQSGSYQWTPGSPASATVALDTANYVNLTINGVGYKLGLVT